MPRNTEIKARIPAVEAILPVVAALATQGPVDIQQDDSFFHCARGRLKLRVFDDGSGELIAYDRPDAAGPKTSTYVRTPAADPASLREALTASCGLLGRVKKHRVLYLIGRTRVHLDQVEGLGSYLELEVVLTDDESPDVGLAEAEVLMQRLGIGTDDLVVGAYLDLLAARPVSGR
jgi:predicted adenylyl cyclase CyaB